MSASPHAQKSGVDKRQAITALHSPDFKSWGMLQPQISTSNGRVQLAETRMDLKEAATLLGLTPNAVRHRAKKGQFPFDISPKPYETGNQGKWSVFFDPDRLPPSNNASNSTSNSGSKRPSNESKISGEIKALQGHVKTLEEALSIERAETARLRSVEAESIGLKVKVGTLDEALSIERAETARLRLAEAESVDLKVRVASLTIEKAGLQNRIEDMQKVSEKPFLPPDDQRDSQANPPEAAPKTAPQSGKGFIRGLLSFFR